MKIVLLVVVAVLNNALPSQAGVWREWVKHNPVYGRGHSTQPEIRLADNFNTKEVSVSYTHGLMISTGSLDISGVIKETITNHRPRSLRQVRIYYDVYQDGAKAFSDDCMVAIVMGPQQSRPFDCTFKPESNTTVNVKGYESGI